MGNYELRPMNCERRYRLLGVFALLVFLLPMLGVAPAYAQAVTSPVVVDVQSAKPNFPDTVEFHLQAHGYDIARAELNYRLVGDPVTVGQQAPIASTTNTLDLQVTLDLATHYIPPGAEVAYHWTLTGEQGDIETPENTFIMPDNRYTWRALTDSQRRVTVHWYEGDNAFGTTLLTTASSAFDRLEHDTGAKPDRMANIYIYATQDDLINALPKNIPEWVGGKAFPELSLVLGAISGESDYESEVKRIVPHELSHLLLYEVTRNPYNSPPAWLDEGLAVHNQETHDPAEVSVLQQAAEEGRLIPLKALSGSFGANDETAMLSYGESRSAIDFIFKDNRYGPEKFARTVAAFKGGVTYDDALMAGLGVTVDELDKEWRDSLPYKAASPGTAPAPSTKPAANPSAITRVWSNVWPYVVLPLALCGLLFVIGGIITTVVLIRRRRPSL